jgi:SAM-dependent methyltransferase
VLARRLPTARLLGVDACADEIERARARLGARVELRVEPAQALGLEPASVDAALSHHAFYLFDPIEPAVERLARALRPGAVFAFMTLGPQGERDPLWSETMALFGPLTRRDNPHFVGWGDQRQWTESGIGSLLASPGPFEDLAFEPIDLFVDEPPADLCERLMRFFYSVDLQREETREELRRAWTALFERHAGPNETVRFAFPSMIVRARRRRLQGTTG